MPQPPTADRLTAGERRFANVIDSSAAPTAPRSAETTATRPGVDLIWDADPRADTATSRDA